MAVPFNATGLWPSANYGDAPKYASGVRGQVGISPRDRDILRDLAERFARLAGRPEEAQKRERWHQHNDLWTKRPAVLVDPENGWNELVTPESLTCRGDLARRWEMVLRKELFWGESIKDDKPLEALFEVGCTYTDSEWGMPEEYHPGSAACRSGCHPGRHPHHAGCGQRLRRRARHEGQPYPRPQARGRRAVGEDRARGERATRRGVRVSSEKALYSKALSLDSVPVPAARKRNKQMLDSRPEGRKYNDQSVIIS